MRNIKDIYRKVRGYSLLSAAISALGLLGWFILAIASGNLNFGAEIGDVVEGTQTLVWFWVLVGFILLGLITASVTHFLLERKGTLVTADEYKRNKELMREREILRAESEQAKIDSTDKVKRKNVVVPAMKEFFANVGEFFSNFKDNVVEFTKKQTAKFKEKNAEMSEKRTEKKKEKLEAKEAREAELARIREEERIEDEKRQAEEAVRLEAEKVEEEKRLVEKAKQLAKEEAIREKEAEAERKRQEKLDQQKALAEKKAREAEATRKEAELAEQAKAEEQRLVDEEAEKKRQETLERQRVLAEKKAKEATQARMEEELAQQAKQAAERKEQELLEKEEADKQAKAEAEAAALLAAEAKAKEPKEEEKTAPKKPAKKKVVTKTKADFIELIFETTGVSKNKANKFLKFFAQVVKESLVAREDVDLPEIGTFTTIEMPAKEAVNPQTKEHIIVPAHHQVRFRVSDEFKDKFH